MQARRHAVTSLVLGAAIFFCWTALAQAAIDNIVPNPSFETGCTAGGVPTSWEFAFSGPVCSTTHNTGTWGLQVTVGFNGQGVYAVCVNRALAAAPYAASFAYATTDTNVNRVTLRAIFYGNADCNSSTFFAHRTLDDTTITNTGAFETVSGTLTPPAGTLSARFGVEVGCPTGTGSACTPDSATAVFDDVSFDASAPLAATFRGLSARRTAKGTLVTWQTASEVDVLGFHVYRQVNGRRVRVSDRLIAVRGRTSGARYSFLDRRARRDRSARYWIQVVGLDGSRTWHGPARVASG